MTDLHTVTPHHQVLPGGRIPTDGQVVSGESFVNEAMITGEPLAVHKGAGDALIGGTIAAGGSGALLMRATRVGSETTLSQIVRLVQQAQMAKAPVQVGALCLGDQVDFKSQGVQCPRHHHAADGAGAAGSDGQGTRAGGRLASRFCLA